MLQASACTPNEEGQMMRYATATIAALAVVTIEAAPARAQCSGMASHGGHAEHEDATEVEGHRGTSAYRSPGLAAALSLTPIPVDFGNLYSESIGWGIAYTSVELAMLVPMMFIVGDHEMGHSATSNPWSNGDRNWMIGLVSGYVVVKVVSGLHAAHNAEVYNNNHAPRLSAAIVPASGGAAAVAALRF